MKIVTSQQMQKVDETAIQTHGISRLELMENAGRVVFSFIKEEEPHLLHKKGMVVCGKGNNGGDGFVVARLLFQKKVPISIYLVTKREELKGEALINFKICERLGIPIHSHPQKAQWIVDALFGTGLHSSLSKKYKAVIQTLNQMHLPILSIDIPSGIDGTTGKVMGECIKATWTVTFGLPKLGQWLLPGIDYTGKLVIKNIGFPSALLKEVQSPYHLIQKKDFKEKFPKRLKSTHKGKAGHVLIIAGSPGKIGAAVMTAQSAFRSGAGLVTLLTHPKSLMITAPQVKEAFLESFPVTEKDFKEYLKNKNAIAIGPGLGFSKEAQNLVQWTLKHAMCPVVLDADGLTLLAKLSFRANPRVGKRGIPLILTPHPGEMVRIIGKWGKSVGYVQHHRLEVARDFSKKYKVYLILKGAGSILATPKGELFINPTGNPAMATAGMGDVLTGMIVSFLAQGMPTEAALKAALYLHGWMADQWVLKTKAHQGLMASDLIQALPSSIEHIL